MDVLSVKPELLNPDFSTTPSPTSSTSDDTSFFDVMSNMFVEQPMPTPNEKVSELLVDTTLMQEQPEDSALIDNTTFYDINLLLGLQKNEEVAPTLVTNQTTPDNTLNAESETKLTSDKIPEQIPTDYFATINKSNNDNPIADYINKSNNDNPIADYINKSNNDKPIADYINKSNNEESNNNEYLSSTLTPTPQSHAISTSLDKPITDKSKTVSENPLQELTTINVLPKEITQFSPEVNVIEQKFQQDNSQNKYVGALTQMSDFINAQTTRYAQNNEASIFNNLSTHSLDYAESLKKTARPDYELNIQMIPAATLDSIKKESYQANMKIYPPELGQIIAKLKVDKNNAELVIHADNNVVKQIIEANLSTLRDNFQQADINLTNITVQTTQSDPKEQNNKNPQSSQSLASHGETNETDSGAPQTMPGRKINSLIDTYA